LHEAGYDSLLTAQVFIKMSAQQHDEYINSAIGTAVDSSNPGQDIIDKSKETDEIGITKIRLAVADHTKFESLADLVEEPELECHSTKSESSGELSLSAEDEGAIEQRIQEGELIPRFGSEFWKVYGNKLRIFGTEERVCVLGQ
jgi:poly(A)-specific ribonuclease